MKIGILGGTFDPVHRGHLKLAEIAQKQWGLGRIIFVPAFSQPLKNRNDVASPAHREAMLRLAVMGHPHWEISDIELNRGGKSYTYDTIQALKKMYPDDELFFITGADCVHQFSSWHKFPELIKICRFIIFNREGFYDRDFLPLEKVIGREGVQSLKDGLTKIPPMVISSTDIRAGLHSDRITIKFLPAKVLAYIRSNKLYL